MQYSPGLSPAHFYLFCRMKLALKGRDVNDIIKNATEELKRFSKYGFQECFPHIHSRFKKRIFAQGTYFEGNVTAMIALSCSSQK